MKAHFKIYLPRTHQREEFCEDLPQASETLFILEYGHDSLAEMLIDFRIIHEVTGKGKFTREEDLAEIEDLDAVTVFHRPSALEPDVLSAVYHFDNPGWYVGILTATSVDESAVYTAVFPFEVGFTGYGFWPLVALVLVIMLLLLWYDQRHTPTNPRPGQIV
jgi:hypothetical protein